MRNLQVFDNLHQQPMNTNNTTQVNPVPVDYMDCVVIGKGPDAGSTDFIWKASQELGGALFSPKTDIPLPKDWTATHFAFNRRVQYLTPNETGRDEFDLKITLAAGQINLSNQINWGEGGQWQSDPFDPPKWEDDGINIAHLLTPGFNDFMFRGSTDGAVWSLDSIACNGTVFTALPANCKNVPLKKNTGWGLGVHTQFQVEVQNCPAYCVIRYQLAQVVLSDAAIPMGWM